MTVPPDEPRRSSRLVSRASRETGRHRVVVRRRSARHERGTHLPRLARTQPRLIAVRAVESALRQQQLDRAQLVTLATKARGWPGGRRMQVAMALADPRSESLLETAGRLLLSDAGLVPAEVQLPIRDEDGHLAARADLGWPAQQVVVAFDGLTPHTARAAFRHDRRRQNALMNRGWLVLRFTWEDVFARPAYVVQEGANRSWRPHRSQLPCSCWCCLSVARPVSCTEAAGALGAVP